MDHEAVDALKSVSTLEPVFRESLPVPTLSTDATRTEAPSTSDTMASEIHKSTPTLEAHDSLPQVAAERVASDQNRSPGTGEHPVERDIEDGKDADVDQDADLKFTSILEQLKLRQTRIETGEEADDVTTRPPTPKARFDPDEYFNSEEYADFFSGIRSAAIYRAYQIRMRRKDKNSNKGGDLITAMVDYVTKVEDDMARLEKTLDDERLARGMTREQLAKEKGEFDETSGEDRGHEEGAIIDLTGITLETRFYHCDGVFDSEGDFTRDGRPSPDSGHYLSNTDATHFLRVLYDWKNKDDTSNAAMVPGQTPDAAKVEIISFMVSSQPIADFFEKRLGLCTDGTRVIRVAKPFRSIIRTLPRLRSHLAFLDNKYGRVPTDVDDSLAPQGHIEKSGDESDAGDNSVQMDPKSVSPTHAATQDICKSNVKPGAQVSGGKACSKTEKGDEAEKVDKVEKAESFETSSALPHFRLLIEFIDHYLGNKAELFEQLQVGRVSKVAYEDLWMLFDTGDTVYCPSQAGGVKILNRGDGDDDDDIHTTRRRYLPQAYRVAATVGGAPLRKNLAPKNTTTGDDSMSEDALIRMFTNASSMRTGLGIQPVSLSVPRAQRMKEKYTPLHVICIYVDFNGVKYGTDTEIFVFRPFDGEMDIKNLEAFPLQYLSTEPSHSISSSGLIKERSPDTERREIESPDALIERGRKFIDVTAVSQHMNHTGLTVGESKEEINSAVIVDFKLAFTEYQKSFPEDDSVVPKFVPLTKFWPTVGDDEIPDFSRSCNDLYCHRKSCIVNEYYSNQRRQLAKLQPTIRQWLEDFDNMADKDEQNVNFKAYMQEKDLIRLLPGVVPGFSLRNRVWVQLNLDQLEYVQQQDDWKKLVLPKGHRDIVQAMVETHSRGSGQTTMTQDDKVEMDLVRGKGRGCIILLHGVPGVGKTSTAECVASYTKRPLYPITCGDIGYEPEAVEFHMGKHFKLAHRWGCVLLLDEADVFLAKRNKSDVKRNGLVSSFLRILEYYSGILFLTTNRVGALDDAFRSRLHLTLYYPQLTEKQTIKIWKTNLERLRDINEERLTNGRVPINFNDKKIISWVKKHWRNIQWNGRQIRNAFQTAMALAEFKAKQATTESSGSANVSPVLDTEHFKLLATASAQFSEYLRVTHGEDEEEVAVRDQVRAVSFQPKTKMRDFSDEDDEEDDSSGPEEEDSNSEEGSSAKSEASYESESEDSGREKKTKSKKARKNSKDKEAKSKSHRDERKNKSKGKGRMK